ncbi:hypothetical protein [Actinomadura flavalba]|uniref:hypothetical protein n=1 Tax=Actinomadura flavalba TaxID=1120938 RepID=UPI000369F3A3|nr:hypothetical protein [Actinomadura flavalba]
MTVFPGLLLRVASESERHVRDGLERLGRLTREHGPGAEARRSLALYDERLRRLESALTRQDAGLRSLRADLDLIVTDLNERLLPRLDERMDDTERDVAAITTDLLRTGRAAGDHTSRLDALDRRVSDLRTRLAGLDQRASLWRELQATLARLGDDVDTLRATLPLPPPQPLPLPHATPEPTTT